MPRYLMTVVATASNPRFSVSRVDIDRGGPTYTKDTLRDLEAHAEVFRFLLKVLANHGLVDGKTVGEASYGQPSPGTATFWRISTDPNHPKVGFSAQINAATAKPGRHWLGLRLHGLDGSVEEWEEQPVEIGAD